MNNGRRLILRNKDYKDFKKNQEASLRDYLTGLPSRRALYEHYSMLSHNSTIHMMFIDIDNFKRVNDTYGHSEGDKLLCSVSNLLTTIMEDQRVYRIGGDEFIVMVDGSVAEGDLIEKVETILDTLHDMDFRKDILSLISLSIGIVFEQNNSQMLDEVLNKCDSAMYQAKIDGKNRYVLYRALEKEMETNRLFESEMETALATGQFKVFLQPKVNMLNSKLEGAEALARWVHPQDGVRAPIQFIPLFEKNGFIIRLDLFIFEEVCRIKNSWKGTDLEHLKVSANMSRLHLYQRDFPDVLKGIADKYDIPTCELEIEITESTFFKDTGELIRMVESLEYNGFSVSIDDFGSGYSALNMLKDIPVETIKIERNFLRLSSNDLRGKKVIKNIIIMCKELKLNIVAEGVETKEHIEFLTSCGCEVAQGFYYSKPVPVEQFVEFSKEYLNNGYKPTLFTFNETLSSDDGEYTASYHIDSENPVKYEFVPSPFRGRKAVRLPGGVTETNCFSIPEKVLSSENFTISMWIKINELTTWGSAIYIKHETGFASIIPHAWEGHSTFRIRDSKNVNGWHDTAGCQFPVGVWVHTAAIYNAKTETTVFMINGDVLATSENVPTQRFVKRILFGGDVFQNSIKADICELKLYNDVKSPVEIKEMFEEYTSEPDFIQPWETE
ncbi:MAG: EAL domain-containing protein [Lachnospiraceae bacterium]|nr:EAL domain-containing protein [Lachnospiraceae bacterium]